MAIHLRGRSLLTLFDLSTAEIDHLLGLSQQLKAKHYACEKSALLDRKNVVLVFSKPSTRTRCAFETAVFSEGGNITFLGDSHLGHKESMEDTAKVLGQFYDGIGFRGFAHGDVEMLAAHAGVPVWNGLTNEHHPTQILGDLLTIREHIHKPFSRVKLAFLGDGRNNVARSLMIGAAKMGMYFVTVGPKALWPEKEFFKAIQDIATETGAEIRCDEEIDQALKDVDVIYTDVWVSMGEESEWSKRIQLLKPYQVNQVMFEKTQNKKTIFMHCLPAFHDLNTEVARQVEKEFGLRSMEVTDEVFRGPRSRVFEQSENRMHTLKAIMVATIGDK